MRNMSLTGPASQRAPKAAELADWALARGISSMTTGDISELLGIPEGQVRTRLHQPRRKGLWVSPASGLWIPVPPEYRTWGAPEGIEIVDTLMRHLGTEYYVGWLSAAAIHGASHHAPQRFQVAASRAIRNRAVGRTSFEFFSRSRIGRTPTIDKETRSGAAKVSSVEATALDIADSPYIAGGLDTSATVLIELADEQTLSIETLVSLSDLFPGAAARRLGWILSTFTDRDDLEELSAHAAAAGTAPSKLDPSQPSSGPIDKSWSLIINTHVAPDA